MESWETSDLKLPAHVELVPGDHLHQGDGQLLGSEGHGHGQGLVGLQEAGADARHPFSLQDGRDGHQVRPAETGMPGANPTSVVG